MSTAHAIAPRTSRFSTDEFFGHQVTSRAELPNPTPMVENLSRSVLEILAGARDLDQIARWVTDDVYRHLLQRVHVSQRARAIKKQPVTRPHFTLGNTIITEPADGVVEAVVIVHGRARSRSIAMRLEGLDGRWRATAVHVL